MRRPTMDNPVIFVMEKLKVDESILIMKPTYPLDPEQTQRLIAAHMPKRKIYHNCAGKHLAMILMSMGMGCDPRDYWKPDSAVQSVIKRIIGQVAGYPAERITVGIDGCGVPVYALPLEKCAMSFATLSDPSTVQDSRLVKAIDRVVDLMHRYPHMIEGEGTATTALLRDDNIVAKEGAEGLYCFAMKRERLAFALKVADGAHRTVVHVIQCILRQLGYKNNALMSELYRIMPREVYNDNDLKVGYIEDAFRL